MRGAKLHELGVALQAELDAAQAIEVRGFPVVLPSSALARTPD